MEEAATHPAFEQLLQAARAGNREALGELFTLFRRYLLSIAEGDLDAQLRPKGSGTDLVQEVFLQAQQLLARFTGDRADQFRAWLRAVLLNKLAEFRKRYHRAGNRQVHRETSLDVRAGAGPTRNTIADDAPTPSATVARWEEAERLTCALARLPASQQQVIHLRNWCGLSFVEIGERLGKTQDAARMIWGRAIERLQSELEGLRS
jgi:RNA polymerase sigma-70 factor (ECF subfamily)